MTSRLGKGNRIKIGYLCSYFPHRLFEKLGFETFFFGEANIENCSSNSDMPINICGYVRYCQRILDDIELDGIVLTNCCNGMQRLYDFIKLMRPELFCRLIELPRDNRASDYKFYRESLENTLETICKHFNVQYHEDILKKVCDENFCERVIDKGTIYILGSAISPPMRDKLAEYLKPYTVKMNYCANRDNGDKLLNLLSRNYVGEDNDILFDGYELSDIEPCAHMNKFSEWFESFIIRNCYRLAGVIYISSQHCDSSLFSFPSIQKICRQYDVPILGMEEGYMNTSFSQVSTRLEAFLESLCFDKKQNFWAEENFDYKVKLSSTFVQKLRMVNGILPKLPLRAIQKVVSNQIDIFTKKVWECPEKVVWTNMVMTVEIFYSVGLIPVNMELVAGWLASLGLSKQCISRSEGMGFSSGVCSYHKATLGIIEEGGLPRPRGAAISSHICDGGPAMVNYFSRNYNTDSFILNVPFHDEYENLQYVTRQYEDLVRWVENYSGNQVAEGALIRTLELSNEARKYWIMALELRKGRPLFPGHLSLRNMFGATFLFGSQLGVDVAKDYYEQLYEMSKMGENKSNCEKKRLLWIHFAPLYGNGLMQYLEQELNCWIVMDINSYIYWLEYDLKKPLESLAKRTLSHFYLNEAQNRKELYCRLIKEYRIDGIIHFMHNGCRAIPGSSWLVRDIAYEFGLPYLELAGDCIDPRGFSEEQMRLRVEAFKETLGGRKFVHRN